MKKSLLLSVFTIFLFTLSLAATNKELPDTGSISYEKYEVHYFKIKNVIEAAKLRDSNPTELPNYSDVGDIVYSLYLEGGLNRESLNFLTVDSFTVILSEKGDELILRKGHKSEKISLRKNLNYLSQRSFFIKGKPDSFFIIPRKGYGCYVRLKKR